MDRARLIIVSLVALVLAVGAALMARSVAAPRAPKAVAVAPVEKPTVQVLVAKRDLAVGDRIDPTALGWQAWPADNLNAAYVTEGPVRTAAVDTSAKLARAADGALGAAASVVSPDSRMAAFANAVVRQPILKGDPVTEAKVVRAGASGVMAVTLDPGMRAMSLPVTADNGAGGFIMPGDHVDVVQVRRADSLVTAATVMRNVRVLAIDQNTNSATGKTAVAANAQTGTSATLELSPAQAEALVLAKAQGELTLVLRSYADAQGFAATGDLEGANQTVRVFRMGIATDVKVAR